MNGNDPLPSWNNGAAKKAIVEFVDRTVRDAVPVVAMWALLLLIFTVVFIYVFKAVPQPGDPSGLKNFPLYFLSGILPFNFFTTDNLNLQPSDYDPFCVTVPVDSRLPTSGQQLCGLYNARITPAASAAGSLSRIDAHARPGLLATWRSASTNMSAHTTTTYR